MKCANLGHPLFSFPHPVSFLLLAVSRLFVYRQSLLLPFFLSVVLSVLLLHACLYVYVCLFVYLSACLSVCLCLCVFLPILPPVCLCISVFLSVPCPSVYLYFYIYMFINSRGLGFFTKNLFILYDGKKKHLWQHNIEPVEQFRF